MKTAARNSEHANLMTEGSIPKKIVSFAIPLFLGNLFQQLYNTADSLIVGNFLGSDALAAVSSSSPLIFLMVGFFNGLSLGAGVVIAHYYGAEKDSLVSRAVHTTVSVGLICGVLLTFIGLVFGSVPMLYKKAKIEKPSLKYMVSFLAGAIIVGAMAFLPQMNTAGVDGMSLSVFFLQILTGIVVAIGFILPGISTSYLLLLLGTYDFVMASIASLDILALVPFVLGFILGVILLTRILEICMQRYPGITYTLILGFLIGSVYTVYPGTPQGMEILYSVISFALGFVLIYFVSVKEAELDEKN